MMGLTASLLPLPHDHIFPALPCSYVNAKRAFAESAAEGLPPLVIREKCDLLALAVAPSVRGPPLEVLDVLRTAKTSVLIWQPKQQQQAGSGFY